MSHSHHLQPPSAAAASGVLPARPFILLPLYIYPAPGAWQPLYDAADAYPELNFWVVINPANGPGEGPLPDANYVEALARMTAQANIKVIGYVHCSYGVRVTEDIVADIEAYGRWEGEMEKRGVDGESIVVDGIFIDEVPSSTEFVEYMAALANATKTILNRNVLVPNSLTDKLNATAAAAAAAASASSSSDEEATAADEEGVPSISVPAEAAAAGSARLAGPAAAAHAYTDPSTPSAPPGGALTPSSSSAVVIYNPGVVVDPIFYQAADHVVAFENAARAWTLPVVRQGLSRLPRALLPRSVVVAHSAEGPRPSSGRARGRGENGGEEEEEEEACATVKLCRKAAGMGCVGQFVTSRGGYTEWCPDWMEFVGEMAKRTQI